MKAAVLREVGKPLTIETVTAMRPQVEAGVPDLAGRLVSVALRVLERGGQAPGPDPPSVEASRLYQGGVRCTRPSPPSYSATNCRIQVTSSLRVACGRGAA